MLLYITRVETSLMTASSSKSTSGNADITRPAGNKSDKRGAAAKSSKHQPDGSKVSTPPSDPANSDETLRRNKNGNS